MWDLIGSVNFAETEVPTRHGVLKVTINRAKLCFEFDGCEMPQGDVGYLRHAPESREVRVRETSNRWGVIGGNAGGRIGWGLGRGFGVSAGADGQVSNELETDRMETEEFSEIRYLVAFSSKEPRTDAMEWAIESVDEKKGLVGAVIHEQDSQGGRLGTLKSSTKEGWVVQPKVKFEPRAEIVNEQELTAATQSNLFMTRRMNQVEKSRKLGIISALLGRELEHVTLNSLPKTSEKDNE